MNNKTKLIIAGTVVGLLLLAVIYVNLPDAAPKVDPKAQQATDAIIEENKNNPAPEPDMSKVPEAARKPGGKMRPPG